MEQNWTPQYLLSSGILLSMTESIHCAWYRRCWVTKPPKIHMWLGEVPGPQLLLGTS